MWGPVAAFLQPGVCPIFLLTSITSLFYWPARFLCLLWAFGLFRAVSTCRATVAMSLGAERQLGCGSQSWGTLYGAWGVRASLLTSSCSYCSPFWVTVSFLRRGDFPGVAQVFPILDIFVLLCALWRQSILGGDGGEGERRDCPPPIVSNHSQGFTQSFFILPNHCPLQARSGPSSWCWGSTQTLEMAFLLAVPFLLEAQL